MCGIAGVISRDPQLIDPRFADAQLHRGPDQQGVFFGDGEQFAVHSSLDVEPSVSRIALIHHRLSIIDLSELGRQPMSSADGRFHLVYNGEVYNYLELQTELRAHGVRFETRTDSEVVLKALIHWGKAALRRFEGMFAFALWDNCERKLLLARDFFGIKPLHYHHSGDRFVFASEMKTLMRVDRVQRQLDPEAALLYLRHAQTDDGKSTLIRDIHQIEPGCWMELRLDRLESIEHGKYWELERQAMDLSLDDAVAHLRDLFVTNIERHLRADVAVGAALSGGVDSSAIVSTIRYLKPEADLHTFSYISDDERLSEEHWVDLAVKRAGAIVHKIRLEPNELIDDLDDLVMAQDQPFGSTSIYAQFRVFRAAREAGVKVMLDGQGADEILGGYFYFLGARIASMILSGRVVESTRFLRNLQSEHGFRAIIPIAGQYLLPDSLQMPFRALVGRATVSPWFNADWFRKCGVDLRAFSRPSSPGNLFSNELVRATRTALPHLLRYEDRNSMHFSIESRVPFLTPELAEFAISLPESYLLDLCGTTKSLFRRAMRGIVPDQILDRRDKIGFATPENDWLRRLKPWVETVLDDARGLESGPIAVEELKREWQSLQRGKDRKGWQFWRCLNLLVWLQRNDVSTRVA